MKTITRHAFVVLPLAALFMAAPASLNGGKLVSYDAAFAAKGGNGNGNSGNGAGNGGSGAGNGASANAGSNGNHGQGNNGNGKGSSELGALDAAHASSKALENAAATSRVGKIAAYKAAAEAAVTAGDEAATAIATAI